jgi:hypothetical protein
MNTTTKAAGIAAATLAGYDTLVRPRKLNWGARWPVAVPGGAVLRVRRPGGEVRA